MALSRTLALLMIASVATPALAQEVTDEWYRLEGIIGPRPPR